MANRLRDLMQSRVTLGTQDKVAEKADLGQSTIQRILSGTASPTVDVLTKLADAFDITPSSLLAEDEDDAKVLSLFRRLDRGDRARVLGFLEVATEAQEARQSLDISRSQPLPPASVPGIRRASQDPSVSTSTSLGLGAFSHAKQDRGRSNNR